MTFGIKIKTTTTTHNQKRLVSLKYVKKPCHLSEKRMCEFIHVFDEIDRITGMEHLPQRKDMHKYYLYIPENNDSELKLFVESRCLEDRPQNMKTIYDFLVNVLHFLHEVRTKDKIKGLQPILAKVEDFIKRATKRRN